MALLMGSLLETSYPTNVYRAKKQKTKAQKQNTRARKKARKDKKRFK